jgi:hypothetical protein
LPDDAPVRVAAINEKRLVHADSIKHRDGGIALTREQYMTLPGIVAAPDAVYFDQAHRNFALVRHLADGGVIFVGLDTAATVKHVGVIDALVNAFRLPATPEGAGRLKDARRFVMMGRK